MSIEASQRGRDAAEVKVQRTIDSAVRAWLGHARTALVGDGEIPSLTAAAAPLGDLSTPWATLVDTGITAALLTVYHDGAQVTGFVSATERAAAFIATVRDRLVQGLMPPLPVHAFDLVREVLTLSVTQGWGTRQTSQRIANVLSWETNGPYWRGQYGDVSKRIDAILDPLGPVGSLARETARLSDPIVTALQAERSDIRSRLDGERSYWQNRATLIARTETTSAWGAGANDALLSEGVETKQWIATPGARTRPSHAQADRQTVPVTNSFIVGGSALRYPGDPNAPVAEIAACRCTVIQGGL